MLTLRMARTCCKTAMSDLLGQLPLFEAKVINLRNSLFLYKYEFEMPVKMKLCPSISEKVRSLYDDVRCLYDVSTCHDKKEKFQP